jgi:protein-S-isoprenylcysteine O-methyltransferase Ste14
VFLGVWFGGLFVGAGTVRWLRGWIFTVALLAMYAIGTAVVFWKNPELPAARANWHYQDMRSFDRVFIALMFPLYIAQPFVAGLDAVRFRWSSMPYFNVYAGFVLLGMGTALMMWAMVVNRFAEGVVRIQRERAHTTVTAGPYQYVRHPMYAGAIVMFLAIGLVFTSWWTLAVGLALSILVVWRTAMEDGILRRELQGYEEFAANTRYRLIPGLW